MAKSNCWFWTSSENPRGFSVWCVFANLSANPRNYSQPSRWQQAENISNEIQNTDFITDFYTNNWIESKPK